MSGLVALRCSGCLQPLEGGNGSRVFFCRACRAGYDLEERQLTRYELHAVKPLRTAEGDPVYVPFWAIESRVSGVTGGAAARLTLVPALFIKNVSYFGDIGLFYTRRRVPLGEAPIADYPVLPAGRGLRTALAYPPVYMLLDPGTAARSEPPAGLRFEPLRSLLLLVPFTRRDGEFTDSLLGWRYPSGALA